MKKILALLLAMMMLCALCACGGGEEAAPAEAAPAVEAAPAEAAPAAPAEGEAAPAEEGASGEPTGEPVATLVEPDASYSKDLDGYKAYVIDALKSDPNAPPDIIEMTVENINAVTDGNATDFDMMINQGLIVTYDDFLAY